MTRRTGSGVAALARVYLRSMSIGDSAPPSFPMVRDGWAARAGLWGAIIAYSVILSWLSTARYIHFAAAAFDLGIFDQAIWLLSRGLAPASTVRGMDILADHFSPVLILFAPLYWLVNRVEVLLVVQSVILALGALPVYGWALRRLKSDTAALVCALAYLAYPALAWMHLDDFHPDALVTPLFALAAYLLDCGRYRRLLMVLVVVALCKETFGLTAVCFAVPALSVFSRRRIVGIVCVGALSTLGAMAALWWLSGGHGSPYISLYALPNTNEAGELYRLSAHLLGVLWPGQVADGGGYIVRLLMPVAFLCLLAPRWLTPALPHIAMNMLSSRSIMHAGVSHYDAAIIPFIIFSAAEGLARVQQLPCVGSVSSRNTNVLGGGVLYLLLVASACAAAEGPVVAALHPEVRCTDVVGERCLAQALSIIPSDASVTAPAHIVPHLTHRRHIYLFPNPFWVLCWGGQPEALAQEAGSRVETPTPESFAQYDDPRILDRGI